MQCVVCKGCEDRVVDSRSSQNGNAIRRRRECLGCGRRFTTYERVEAVLRTVVKKDSRREPFSREKLLRSMRTACQKRQVSAEQLCAIADRIEGEVFSETDGEVSTRAIGERVTEELKVLDKVAYVRFASVYREFTDVTEFAAVLLPFLSEDARAKLIGAPALVRTGAEGEGLPRVSIKEPRNGKHQGSP